MHNAASFHGSVKSARKGVNVHMSITFILTMPLIITFSACMGETVIFYANSK